MKNTMKGGETLKIITFAAIKGGVGKTTLAFNLGEYLAYQQHQRVLFMDLDHQCNLTQTYGIYDSETTIGNAFTGQGQVTVHPVDDQISVIAGDMHLDQVESAIETQPNKNMLLYMWLMDQYEDLHLGQYDYLIIDTHPDFSVATKNAAIISHLILSPITPSEHGYNAKFNLQERLDEFGKEAIDYATRKSYLTAELRFIANMVKHNTKSSHDLMKALKDDPQVVAEIPERELFNRSTLDKESLAQMMANEQGLSSSQKRFLQEMATTFGQLKTTIDAIAQQQD